MQELTQARVKELLSYNKKTGVLTWKKRRGGAANRGAAVTSRTSAGYVRIGIDGVRYNAHRVIWLYVHGVWPTGFIDHKNGVRDDNRLSNLRDIPPRQNPWNQRRPQQRNKYLGVYETPSGKFQALITVEKKRRYLGLFDTAEQASAAYQKAKSTVHAVEALPASKIPHVEV